MKIELKTSFLFGLLIGLLLVLLFGKPRKAAKPVEKPAEKPAAKPESARPHRRPAGGYTSPYTRAAKTTIDVEPNQPTGDAEFDAETARLDAEAFAPLNQFLQGRKQKVEPQS